MWRHRSLSWLRNRLERLVEELGDLGLVRVDDWPFLQQGADDTDAEEQCRDQVGAELPIWSIDRFGEWLGESAVELFDEAADDCGIAAGTQQGREWLGRDG
jgi:hypothetical protein